MQSNAMPLRLTGSAYYFASVVIFFGGFEIGDVCFEFVFVVVEDPEMRSDIVEEDGNGRRNADAASADDGDLSRFKFHFFLPLSLTRLLD